MSTPALTLSTCPCCGDPRPPVTWGRLSVSLVEGASWDSRQLAINGVVLSLLHRLARSQGRVVEHDALVMLLPEDATISLFRVHMHRLRTCLKELGLPLHVKTAWGAGYRLVQE